MSFSDLFGMDPQIRSLQRALKNDNLAGCYVFVGPAGVGKTALAMAVAKAAACLNRNGGEDSCGDCSSCHVFDSGTHPEINLISPAGDTTQIWQFWDRPSKPNGILQHSLSYAPTVGAKRVYIIERADTLTESAANSILKSLEEPPPFAMFILLTPHTTRLLPTILSRSQIIRIPNSPTDDLSEFLTTKFGFSHEIAATSAAYSEGRTGAAIRMARNPEISAELEKLVDATIGLSSSSRLGSLRAAEQFRKTASSLKALLDIDAPAKDAEVPEAGGEASPKERVSKKSLAIALEVAAVICRDLLSLSLSGADAKIIHGGQKLALLATAQLRPPQEWFGATGAVLTARKRIEQNVPGGLATDWLALEISR
ncbi:MAG: hypothetical protein ABJA67_18325 [Chthonomonadales bacterium]